MKESKFYEFLNQYLIAYWLRPVTAVVRSLESEIYNFQEFNSKKAMELACGDGTNTFIATGGKLPFDFDVFQSIPLISANDFYSGKNDVYNHFDIGKIRDFNLSLTHRWTKGIDHKDALIKKAKLLGCYTKLEVRDLNTGLNEPENEYDLIFSNSLYWVENITKVLDDIFFSLKPGGILKLSIIKDSFIKEMAWSKLKDYNFKSYIDMGRHKHYQQLKDEKAWENLFKKTGLEIVSKTPTFNKNLVHMIEFHDYREISSLTSYMASCLDNRDLVEVKAKWIEYSKFMFDKMYSEGYFRATSNDSYYNIYVLRKPL